MSWTSRNFAKQYINHYSHKDTNHHIKGSDSAANRRTLVIVPVSVVIDDTLGSGRIDLFTTTADTELDLNTAANWDTTTPTDYTVAATRAGKDFYVYACIQTGNSPKILLSANSTYPSGYTANNSRKIGGFHAMPGACANLPVGHPYKDFEAGSLLFNSIWDLLDRPRCSPEGMAKISLTPSDGKPSLWVDIYLASGDGTVASSVYGATIKDTQTYDTFLGYGRLLGKRFPTDDEFVRLAAGSNEGTAISGASDPVTVGFPSDSAGRSMISNYGIVACCGAMLQFVSGFIVRWNPDGTQATASKTGTAYHAASPGGNPIYVKYDLDGTPYLCCNMATDTVDKWVTFGTDYRILIKHDSDAATGSTQLYIDEDATQPGRLLAALGRGKNAYVPSNNPAFSLQITYNATPATPGVAISYDDGSDERLEFTSPTSANATLDLSVTSVLDTWRGTNYGPGSRYTVRAGGHYLSSTYSGSTARFFDLVNTSAQAACSARFVCEAI